MNSDSNPHNLAGRVLFEDNVNSEHDGHVFVNDHSGHHGAGEALEAISDESASEYADSGFGDGTSATDSLRSSIFDYEVEHGRSYHAFRRGKYVMPNDEREQERMDIHYHTLRFVFQNRHFVAPIEQLTSVLDVGTGTGIWAMDVADDYPDAHVIGIDLSPIQPTAVPPNLEFLVMDADEPWDYHSRFNYVHTRLMNGFSIRSWPFFYEQAFEALQPGGWVENQEFDVKFGCDDNTLPLNSACEQWATLWNEGIQRFGLTGRCYPQVMKEQMEAAGFINVTCRFFRMPIGPWPKDKALRQAGLFNIVGFLDGVSGLSQRVFTKGLGWTVDEMELLLMQVREELKNKRIHTYFPIYVVYGQKPYA
ncbi:S-adenosyl-L-methionine-dependent methyltransferase [Piedraia hortae CBS 480.64]|uniref:S-adenosyl-L-methionine-dependent methyltransferase n=1 Tax=Piedraia hortae CBS 480.64 TaxID=1314780 RepID=A0A6A7BVC4_9PEZI|nr:S-adenosyl-L-methionine-dependent methyltransferase [Piedraia hortae CBS 480.64]